MILLLLACVSGPTPYAWDLPAHFPEPSVPEDNPMSEEAVALGRRLFYDPQLSVDGDMSCASCHQQDKAFTDGRAQGQGTTGELHPRGPMSLANVAYVSRLTWVNPHIDRLEDQALLPLFGDAPVEMGMTDHEDALMAALSADPVAAPLFEAAWPEDPDPVSVAHITGAIASFQRTLISGDSPYDRYVNGEAGALSAEAEAGMQLFFSERLECFHCHGGFNFSDAVDHAGLASEEVAFHNTGLYNLDGAGAYPADNTGLMAFTGEAEDMGRFRAPTLRNIAVTAPYFHDGSAATLDEVIDHYAAGGREITEGPYAGDGSESPYKSVFVAGFLITDSERAQLKAFLEALTDEAFLQDPRASDPFAEI
ncbi:MAG: di-heme enzyme [Alphaproteobacteria bacterium]|nr:di-heme enzyme [Alphaproteobacteria bacterium]